MSRPCPGLMLHIRCEFYKLKCCLIKISEGISGNILTHFEPLLFHKLEWTRYPSVLDYRIVNSYFRHQWPVGRTPFHQRFYISYAYIESGFIYERNATGTTLTTSDCYQVDGWDDLSWHDTRSTTRLKRDRTTNLDIILCHSSRISTGVDDPSAGSGALL